MADPLAASSLETDEISAPVCIVGGGPLGLAVSIGMTRVGIEHILLESGGEEVGAAQGLAGGRNIGMPYFEPSATRIRALGGTTHVWGGHCGPLAPSDFERRDWIVKSGWPLGFEDFRQWLKPAAQSLSLADHWSVDETAADQERPLHDGHGLFDLRTWKLSPVIAGGERSAERRGTFWEFNRERIGARILTQVTARRLAFDEAGAIAALDCRRADSRPLRVRAQRYVLACGGIETARFLLINRRLVGGPLRELTTIGECFMDHPHPVLGGLWLFAPLDPRLLGVRGADGAVHLQRLFLKPEVVRRFRTGALAIGFVPTEQWHGRPIAPSRLVEVTGSLEATPDARSRILISDDEEDEIGDPLTLIDYHLGAADQERAWRCAQLFAREAGIQGLGRVEVTLPRPDTDASQSVFLGGTHSHLGTVRMGENPSTAVVDRNLKVFGIANLYLATCGVFPTSSGVDPTMNAIAFAFRLADHLSREV